MKTGRDQQKSLLMGEAVNPRDEVVNILPHIKIMMIRKILGAMLILGFASVHASQVDQGVPDAFQLDELVVYHHKRRPRAAKVLRVLRDPERNWKEGQKWNRNWTTYDIILLDEEGKEITDKFTTTSRNTVAGKLEKLAVFYDEGFHNKQKVFVGKLGQRNNVPKLKIVYENDETKWVHYEEITKYQPGVVTAENMPPLSLTPLYDDYFSIAEPREALEDKKKTSANHSEKSLKRRKHRNKRKYKNDETHPEKKKEVTKDVQRR